MKQKKNGAATRGSKEITEQKAPKVDIKKQCRLCGSCDTEIVKPANLKNELTEASFAITDDSYGMTNAIYRCKNCGFLQCLDVTQVLEFYENLQDAEYESSRNARSMQAKDLLRWIKRYRPEGRLLDIGAGSGILVGEAVKAGYEAEGVEPSKWLCSKAKELDLPVRCGVFPGDAPRRQYDIITLVDVVEHVINPAELLRNVHDRLNAGGLLLVATPDVRSLCARTFRWKWWHYRAAHIGYFDRDTLERALRDAGFEAVAWGRPRWHFRADYLAERIKRYLPAWLQWPTPGFLKRIVVPLNLRDSLSVIAKKHG